MSSGIAAGMGIVMAGIGLGMGTSFSVERIMSDSTEKLTEERGESIGVKNRC